MDLRVAGVDAEEDNGEETGTREALSSELCRSPLTIRAAERNVDRILSLILAQAVLAASSPQEVPFRRWSRTLGLAIFPSTPQSQMMAEAPHDASLQAHGGKGANGKVAGDGDMVLRKLIHGASQLQVACVPLERKDSPSWADVTFGLSQRGVVDLFAKRHSRAALCSGVLQQTCLA
ncbi:hypothetical protein ColTof3_14568 [Colletotrichum tofieldiae]|nr:hypothetical protein ColTof3_14568 [Colletotrichum tofieldiae]